MLCRTGTARIDSCALNDLHVLVELGIANTRYCQELISYLIKIRSDSYVAAFELGTVPLHHLSPLLLEDSLRR